jgi:hypothetical protein
MTIPITAGSILVQASARLPSALRLQSQSDANGWAAIEDTRCNFEKAIREAGWTFFFMACEMHASAFSFDRPKALRAALKRLTADVRSLRCNCIEIGQVTDKSFLGVPYVRVTAHARHLQEGALFSACEQDYSPAPGFSQDQKKWKVTAS